MPLMLKQGIGWYENAHCCTKVIPKHWLTHSIMCVCIHVCVYICVWIPMKYRNWHQIPYSFIYRWLRSTNMVLRIEFTSSLRVQALLTIVLPFKSQRLLTTTKIFIIYCFCDLLLNSNNRSTKQYSLKFCHILSRR